MLQKFTGTRNFTNVVWSLFLSLGGLGFVLTGFSSFFKTNFLFLSNGTTLTFLPQGITLLMYGTTGMLLGSFLSLIIRWNVGSGYNMYDMFNKIIFIYRKRFPGTQKNNTLSIRLMFSEIRSIKVKAQIENTWGTSLLLCLYDGRQIPVKYNNDVTYSAVLLSTSLLVSLNSEYSS